jgi:tRNA (uracil-5-)-methyltransferase TRM9
MNINTVKKLNQINQNFYKTIASDFDDSRQYFWKGWSKLTKHLNHFNQLKLLDVGCGNARFYQFIKEKISNKKIEYLGLDNNQKLLDFANKKFKEDHPNFKIKNTDLIESLLNDNDCIKSNDFNVVVSFGVFHHIPSFDLRLKLLNYLKSKITYDGIIIISLWQFMDYERFRKKVSKKPKFENLELEDNDFILDWKRGEKAYRYCHLIDDEEQKKLIKESSLELIESFRADGKEKDVNKYLILKKV